MQADLTPYEANKKLEQDRVVVVTIQNPKLTSAWEYVELVAGFAQEDLTYHEHYNENLTELKVRITYY
jgi:hypothetical protein